MSDKRSVRVPLGAQFFAAAIVMGSVAMVMAVSTMTRSASVEQSLDALAPLIVASENEAAVDSLEAARTALAGGEQEGLRLALIVAAIGVGAATFLTLSVGRVSKRLARTAQSIAEDELPAFASAISRLAEGDFTASYESDLTAIPTRTTDEIGDIGVAFNTMIASLESLTTGFNQTVVAVREIAAEAGDIGHAVRSRAAVLADASAESASAATQVATAVADIASGAATQTGVVANLNDSVTQIVDDAAAAGEANAEVLAAATSVTGAAESGHKRVEKADEAMRRVRGSFAEVETTVAVLNEHSEEVVEIVDLIREIADQTNLLALNAAIEAARAGEMGRGFAVVADEVKSLAGEAATATDRIAGIVSEMRASVSGTAAAVTSGSSEVKKSSSVVAEAGAAFAEIAAGIEGVRSRLVAMADLTSHIRDVAGTIANQAASLGGVADATASGADDVAAAAQESAATAEEIGATAVELAANADELDESMARIKTESPGA
ncbi:MAG: HAMP domain-containing methyl-accepting chemotaxis protein [Acidimicrobiia bacterium]|nr:HAMP domain-containing methyl-accepting chemotaxis protein [Acidimicrobiia bacterium]